MCPCPCMYAFVLLRSRSHAASSHVPRPTAAPCKPGLSAALLPATAAVRPSGGGPSAALDMACRPCPCACCCCWSWVAEPLLSSGLGYSTDKAWRMLKPASRTKAKGRGQMVVQAGRAGVDVRAACTACATETICTWARLLVAS